MMTWNVWVGIGALFAGLGVALGAFGSHGLKQILDAHMLAVFETGVRYQIIHSLALIALGLTIARFSNGWIHGACYGFLGGMLLFSGSLYVLALWHRPWVGMITPVGGSILILSWLAFGIGTLRA